MKVKKLNGKINGTLFLDEIRIREIKTVVVSPNNKTSGKINFHIKDVGKTVYVLYPEGDDK